MKIQSMNQNCLDPVMQIDVAPTIKMFGYGRVSGNQDDIRKSAVIIEWKCDFTRLSYGIV